MGFIEAYKRLEKLCGEALGPDRPVTAYIESMQGKPDGAYFVPGWDADLKKLKYCRHIRNKIAHDPGCTEENMCAPGDAAWLESFHRRIMRCEDPLALYRKAKKQNAKHQTAKPSNSQRKSTPQEDHHDGFPWLIVWVFVIAYLIYKFII